MVFKHPEPIKPIPLRHRVTGFDGFRILKRDNYKCGQDGKIIANFQGIVLHRKDPL
jgi:hypothetical protein